MYVTTVPKAFVLYDENGMSGTSPHATALERKKCNYKHIFNELSKVNNLSKTLGSINVCFYVLYAANLSFGVKTSRTCHKISYTFICSIKNFARI